MGNDWIKQFFKTKRRSDGRQGKKKIKGRREEQKKAKTNKKRRNGRGKKIK